MKAKYIFRGFGLGVIITAVIMSAYTRKAVADARINVLKDYGIGEEAALAETLVDVPRNDDNQNVEVVPFDENPTVAENTIDEQNPAPAQTQAAVENVPDADTNGDADANGDTDANGDADADIQGDANVNGDADGENAQTPNSVIVVVPSDEREGGGEDNNADNADNIITIVISQGDSSEVVARKLHSAGLVDSAGEFNAFLVQHGYDKKMRAGTKSISKDASWQEIADKISSN